MRSRFHREERKPTRWVAASIKQEQETQDQAALDHVQNARLLLPAEVASDNAARERVNRRPVNAKSLKPTECLGLNMMRSRAVAGGSR